MEMALCTLFSPSLQARFASSPVVAADARGMNVFHPFFLRTVISHRVQSKLNAY
jgi:hypothetical protein